MPAVRKYLLTVEMDADLSGYRRGVDQVVTETRTGAASAGQAWDGINAHVKGNMAIIGSATTALKGYFAIMAAQAGPQKIVQYSDAWTSLNNRLKLVTDGQKAYDVAQQDSHWSGGDRTHALRPRHHSPRHCP